MTTLSQRCFKNPYEDGSPFTEAVINPESTKEQALELMNEVFVRGVRSGDGGLYVGALGATYMYLHVSKLLSPAEKQKYLPLALHAFQTQSVFNQNHPGSREDLPSFLLGPAGYYAVGAVLGNEIGNQELFHDCIDHYRLGASICKPIQFFQHGSDELFVGRAGYLCGALWMQSKLDFMPIPENDLKDIWKAILESGQTYSKKRKSPSPLMYSYYNTEYLGAAHGLCAILQILLSFPTFINEDEIAAKLIKDSIDFYVTLQDSSGNFPCAMDEVGKGSKVKEDEKLIHWCHGAPGAIYMLAKAYLHYKEDRYLDACIKCGEVVWSRGLLLKGPGICHGVSGNGYVFLTLYNLFEKKDPKYLYRAAKFAEFLSTPTFTKEARRPDCPFSLYEGTAGTVCYLMDLLQPENAEFPFFNVTVNYTTAAVHNK